VVNFTPLYPWGKAPGAYWIGGWVGPRAGLDDTEKEKFLTLLGLELQPITSCYTDYTILALRGSYDKDFLLFNIVEWEKYVKIR
jgi:hypothetical protein